MATPKVVSGSIPRCPRCSGCSSGIFSECLEARVSMGRLAKHMVSMMNMNQPNWYPYSMVLILNMDTMEYGYHINQSTKYESTKLVSNGVDPSGESYCHIPHWTYHKWGMPLSLRPTTAGGKSARGRSRRDTTTGRTRGTMSLMPREARGAWQSFETVWHHVSLAPR